MTAKKMFNDLGYELTEKWDNKISYECYDDIITIYKCCGFDYLNKHPDGNSFIVSIEKPLLKAINKQLEELGWI